ncbi:MAG: hypothetical protein RMJ35_10745 [Phycisphaerales bacterium]|nr:hypothetical protein [Phycisphaerales bacterium]
MNHRSVVVALWVNAALLAAVVVLLVSRGGLPEVLPAAYGQPAQPIAGGAGLFLMPAQFSQNTWGCYVMDVDTQTLCAYQFLPGEKQLRLIAARNFRFDRRLGNFNTTPAPLEVKDLLEKEAQVNRVNGTTE